MERMACLASVAHACRSQLPFLMTLGCWRGAAPDAGTTRPGM